MGRVRYYMALLNRNADGTVPPEPATVSTAPDEFDPEEDSHIDPNQLECYDVTVPVDCPFDRLCPGDFKRIAESAGEVEWECTSCGRTFSLHEGGSA